MNPPVSSDDHDDDWLINDDTDDVTALVPPNERPLNERPWRILIVDDDLDVHSATNLALRNVRFKGRDLELMSAYSGEEAFSILQSTPGIALVLLDVVMETEDAGLRLVGRIRGDLDNALVRIVLRTGQPGQAPEHSVIIDYDINDYKAKTELTTQKLFTTVISSLRAYESLLMIERSRVGLWKILEGATNLYQIRSLREFASGVLNQISAILDVGANGVLCVLKGDLVDAHPQLTVVAATGGYSGLADSETMPLDHPLASAIAKAFREKNSQYQHPIDVMFIHTKQGHEFAISVTPPWPLAEIQRNLLEIFCQRIAVAFDNFYLFDQLQKSQDATVAMLAHVAEFSDKKAPCHVRRVQKLTQAITEKLVEKGTYKNELTPQLFEMIGGASALHDVGKVTIPDSILLKSDVHTPEELLLIQSHAEAGENIIGRAAKMADGINYLSYGAQIAGAHHEHFDGGGYPRGLVGYAIPLAARIVALADACDTLLDGRGGKKAMQFDEMVEFIRQRRGSQFDPEIVDVFVELSESSAPSWL